MPLTIAIDYDGTFTADRELWMRFIGFARMLEHRVIVVSSRTNSTENHIEIQDALGQHAIGVPVVLTGGRSKREAVKALPPTLRSWTKIDIWIDDLPESISMPAAEAVNRVYLGMGQ